jgi:putative phosphoesterase
MRFVEKRRSATSPFICFMQLGIISDTHSFIDDRILNHLADCDMIIHAGDVGDESVLDKLESLNETVCVYGNIDDQRIRKRCPLFELVEVDKLRVLVVHIAGVGEKYNSTTSKLIAKHNPDVLICGHSHILKVFNPKSFNHVHINPGAAGRHGFHKTRTLIKVEVIGGKLCNMRVVELGGRST